MSCKAALTFKAARKSGARARSFADRLCRGLQPLPLALAVALSCLSVGTNSARAEPVRGEATLTAQSGYARMVLQFQEDVPTEVTVAGAILVIQFSKPVAVPIDLLAESVPSYVGSVRRDPDGTAIRMALTQKVRVNVMTAGERVFIDLLPEKWTGLPPALPAEVVKELSERAIAAERALRIQRMAEEAKKRPPVRVRASVQPTFVRFVFEMPDGVSVSSSLAADKFSLSFTSPLTFDLADAKIAMPANIHSINQKIEGETSRIDIAMIGEADVHAFREEKNYVVDVAFEQGQKSKAARSLPKALSTPADKAVEIVPPTSEQVAQQTTKPADTVQSEVKSPEAKSPHIKSLEVAPPEAKTSDTKPSDNKPSVADAKAEAVPAKPEIAAPPVAAPVVAAAVDAPAKAPAASPSAPAKAPQPDSPAMTPAAGVTVDARLTSDDFRLTFPFTSPTPAAVFRRSDSIWLVFDTDQPIDASAIKREGAWIVADATPLDLPKGRALRIRLNRPQLATMIGDERAWTLILADKAQSPPQPLAATRNMADPSRASVGVSLAKPGQIHRFNDPDAGDQLLVMTAGGPARGFMRRQDFVEFALLESIHGVVVQQKSDDLTAGIASDTLILSRPGGLTLSTAMTAPDRATSVVRPVFDVTEWRTFQNAEFIPTRNKLLTAASMATGSARMPAHVDLGRFYLARGMNVEAKGILDLALAEAKPGEEDAAALTVHAVASTLAGRSELALADLANSAVTPNLDSQLWKALALARLQKWAEAREKFKNVEFAITALPVELQRIVIAEAFRASLEVRDYPGATVRSNDLDVLGVGPDQAASIAVLRGRLAEALGRDQDALAAFAAAAGSADRPAASEAKVREIALRQKREEITDDDAQRDLEVLAATWRGDSTEVKTLAMLTRLYAAKARYPETFAAAYRAIQLEPNSEISRKMQDEASALFEQIYNGAKGDDIPPVEALAMFYEFRDLTPIGRRGDEMIRRLADRLVGIDLLDQASQLLQYQIDHRLEGSARAQVASRLAMVYLMNRKPERAIAALRTTRIADLAGEIRQQRLLLEARAQTDIGRHDLALDIISNVSGREAVRLRSDIYWASRRWRESAEQIELLYGDRWRDFQPLTATEKSDVIRAAIGYALAEDAIGLARFREKYNPKMDGGNDRAAFDLAAKPARANSADFARIAKMAATIDTLDGFLREMRVRFPDAMARAKLPPEIKTDPNPTGALPAIKGVRPVAAAR
ncbi:putative negative regulator of RcsB-dependent stress response [Afipia massiliensis]|uniref:Putative negative regulator of RcsB-dependent stress response n=1 Tax=Afipia massiliensis TaxID=211460 RepID=A0A840N2K6_9BRAD|nr:tetratricopeptide repeat protein [Afipia massiliensis]MBB5054313.1 putative negative regulator of RcsB-dependent stress response [Afipia massiliensis]